ncbi:MAG: carbonic anhydrase [Candidatus Dependentiae bacterium]|nr:carbonic anhydrase [Candidatus Dependentiae bacterium]
MSQEIKKLIDGNKQFRKKFFSPESTLFRELVLHGQKPKTMIIACSDSRVDPAMTFDCQPGELFVLRNVANLIPPYEDSDTYHSTSAALEFAADFLEVEHIIIFGHTQCGGIQALLESNTLFFDKKSHGFITKWMELARPARDRVTKEHVTATLEEKITLCEQYALINSLHNLYSFPLIQQRIQEGKLAIHAWYFDLETGIIHTYDQQKNNWNPL